MTTVKAWSLHASRSTGDRCCCTPVAREVASPSVSRILCPADIGRRRPSIWAHRHRCAPAADPGPSGGQPRPCLALHRVGFASHRRHRRRWRSLTPPFHPCLSNLVPRPGVIGGLFSAALSVGSPRLEVIQHPALWCPDFPLRATLAAHSGRPTGSPDGFYVLARLTTRVPGSCEHRRANPRDPRGLSTQLRAR
jgi:hypothetical protein